MSEKTNEVGRPGNRRREPSIESLIAGLEDGDRTMLARAITLVESTLPADTDPAQDLLQRVLPRTGRSIRVGVTGVPGVGKSTFIEALGLHLLEKGRRVAVLAVDPSSSLTGGSILGDKSRMHRLSQHPGAFIRPSPSQGSLGGVAGRTRETILVCEAAGYDVVLVETVGVGQSETLVEDMVDVFLVLMLAGAGDELQGIKRGVLELADIVAVNKADGENRARATLACTEYAAALRYMGKRADGTDPVATTVSALTTEGVPELWDLVSDYADSLSAGDHLERERRGQRGRWLRSLLEEALVYRLRRDGDTAARLASVEEAVLDLKMTPRQGIARVLGDDGD